MMRQLKGYLTIYVSLCMCVMISLCLVLIEGARRSTIRVEGELITDIAMESVLAEYHRELLNQYNLFYVDSSYGSEVPSHQNIGNRLEFYLRKNTVYGEELGLGFLYKDFLGMEFQDVQVEEVRLATDDNGYGFARQAIEAVKDDVGITYLEEVLNLIQKVEERELLDNDWEEKKDEVDSQIQSYDGKKIQLSEKEWTIVDVVSPTKIVDNMQAKGILWWVTPREEGISGQQVDLTQYVSERAQRGNLNQGNGERQEKLEVSERLLFQEYLLDYTGRYGAEKEQGLLAYQTEYLIEGENSDFANLAGVAGKICAVRQVANMAYLLSNTEKVELAKGAAMLLSTGLLIPEAEPLFEAAILLVWGYMESVYDTKALFSGEKIPLIKTDESWHYSLDCIWSEPGQEVARGEENGQTYDDYLRILLFFQKQETLIHRFMDVVEMDIRLTEGNESFRLDGCLDYLGMRSTIHSAYGYDFEIGRERGY